MSYYATLLRFPCWRPDFRSQLIGAEIDPFRVPANALDEPVEITLELYGHSELDVRERVRQALGAAFQPTFEDFVFPPVPWVGPPRDRFEDRPPLDPAPPGSIWGVAAAS